MFFKELIENSIMSYPSIHLSGTKGDSLVISIKGYSYPEIAENYDGNYLTMAIKAKNETGEWEASSPCLLTWEAKWFSKWLRHVVRGNMVDEEISVLDLDFGLKYLDYSNGLFCFVAILKFGLSNKKDPSEDPEINNSSILYLTLGRDDLESFIQFFDTTFKNYPPRGKQGEISLEKLPGPQSFKEYQERKSNFE